MQAVRSENTAPEKVIRRMLHLAGYRYRLHRRDLPGCPDLVFPSRRKVIFIHGCFWHGHNCRRGARVPKSHVEYWTEKVARNRARDERVQKELLALGWQTQIVWECELREPSVVMGRLRFFLSEEPGE